MIKDFDVHKGLELLDEAYSLLEDATSKRDAVYASALIMALSYEALGEYDMALELIFESAKVSSEYSDTTNPLYALVAARIYNALEQPADALEWLRSCSDSLEFDVSQNYSLTAYAYLLLGDVGQAESFLNKAHVIAINSGNEQEITVHFFVRGMIDFSQGNNTSARDNITQSLELADPQFQITVNNCLSALTKIEIAETTRTNDKLDAETSGTWMSRLRKHAYEKNYLGIKMTHALLKSEYQVKIGEIEAAKQTLSTILEISDSMTVKTLRAKITDKLKELEKIQIS
jgi:tetratricopeptide (TPR) repeat protein